MLDIKKMVVVTISGEDIQTLNNICDAAKFNLEDWMKKGTLGIWLEKDFKEMGRFIEQIHDQT